MKLSEFGSWIGQQDAMTMVVIGVVVACGIIGVILLMRRGRSTSS